MPWLLLFTAGLFEVAFAMLLGSASRRGDLVLGLASVGVLIVSVSLLALAVRAVPLHVAYPVWTVIGVAGTTGVSVMLFDERLSSVQSIGLVAIVTGVVLLHTATPLREV